MKSLVFDGYSVKGTPDALEALSIKLSRLAAYETLGMKIPGYPSLITMDSWIARLCSIISDYSKL